MKFKCPTDSCNHEWKKKDRRYKSVCPKCKTPVELNLFEMKSQLEMKCKLCNDDITMTTDRSVPSQKVIQHNGSVTWVYPTHYDGSLCWYHRNGKKYHNLSINNLVLGTGQIPSPDG